MLIEDTLLTNMLDDEETEEVELGEEEEMDGAGMHIVEDDQI